MVVEGARAASSGYGVEWPALGASLVVAVVLALASMWSWQARRRKQAVGFGVVLVLALIIGARFGFQEWTA